MMRSLHTITLVLTLWLLSSFTAHATLLDVAPELPTTEFGSLAGQGIQYNTGSGAFIATGLPLSTRFTSLGGSHAVTGSASLSINIQINTSGLASSGTALHDFVLVGDVSDGTTNYTGTLLTGSLADFGFLDTGTFLDVFDFLFDVTGGSMAGLFGSAQIGVLMIAERSSFTGVFTQNFSSTRIKGAIGRVPEPATLWLAGLALVAIGVMRRRA
jgi:hypothetical protein